MGDLVVCRTVGEVQSLISELKEEGREISLVPTMGALHHGHIALIEQAGELAEYVVVSIFVNPKQFNNPEDLKKYPRPLEADLEKLSELENVIAFVPEVDDIYPADFVERNLDLGSLVAGQEATFRPGHFEGVVNVVSRLFDIVQPDYAIFGEKDYQQLAIIEFMTKELNYDIKIIGAETIREESGLASSSRNYRLNENELEEAVVIFEALNVLKQEAYKSTLEEAISKATKIFDQSSLELEYLDIVDPSTFEVLSDWAPGCRACVAAYCAGVRLIDNMELVPKAVYC